MLAAHPSPACTFRVGRDSGKNRVPLVLEDKEKQVTGICVQMMMPGLMGY